MITSTTRYVMHAFLLALFAAPAVGVAAGNHLQMPMADAPADMKPTRSAYTADHRFLVKLLSMPEPIPFQKHVTLTFAVYDGANPAEKLTDADLKISAGMRHGMKEGFMHGMASTPSLSAKDGVFTVSGMYFTMMGPWTVEATVIRGGKQSVAYFELPCCQR